MISQLYQIYFGLAPIALGIVLGWLAQPVITKFLVKILGFESNSSQE